MPSCPPGREWSRLRKFRSPGATGPLRASGLGDGKGRVCGEPRNIRSPGRTGSSARAIRATERGGSADSYGTSGRQERPDPPHERSGRRKGAGLRTVTEHPVARNDRTLRTSDPGDGKGQVCGQLRNIRSPGTTGSSARAIRATERGGSADSYGTSGRQERPDPPHAAARATERGRSADSYGTSGRQERPDPPHERPRRRKGAGLRTVTEHPVARNDRTLRTSGPGDGKGGSADSYGTSGRQERPDPLRERSAPPTCAVGVGSGSG